MYVAYTPEQEALRQELRAYFAELMTPEVEAEVRRGRDRRARPASRPSARWAATAGSASAGRGVRRPGPHRRRAVHLLQRGVAGRRPDPVPHDQHRRPDDHGVRLGGAEAVLPARRSWPASCTSRSATPSRAPAPTSPRCTTTRRQGRRRVGDQRPEDLHVAGQLRRLHLAGRPHRPRRAEAQGASRSSWCPRPTPGSRTRRSRTMVNASTYNTFYDDVRVGDDAVVDGRQPGLGPHHQPAQLRAGVARPPGHGRADLRGGRGAGRRTPSCPTAGG